MEGYVVAEGRETIVSRPFFLPLFTQVPGRRILRTSPLRSSEKFACQHPRSVGQGSGESKGHESGRRIVEILRKGKSEYTDDDIEHMERVVGYVHRHRAQGPQGEVEDSNWRYSLMNWGHDPLK